MSEARYLSGDRILPALSISCKKQLFMRLAEEGARLTGLDQASVHRALCERERLGPTGLGNGIAIPHARIDGLEGIYGLFVQLSHEIDYEAMDGEPVDLVFMLLAPDGSSAEHLKALAWVSRNLRDAGLCARLRGAESKDAILALFAHGPDHSLDAA